MVAQRLRNLVLEAKTIHIWINDPQNRGFCRQEIFQTRRYLQGMDIFMRSKALLSLKNGKKISLRAIGISVSGLYPKNQPPLLDKEKIGEYLATQTDKINAKLVTGQFIRLDCP